MILNFVGDLSLYQIETGAFYIDPSIRELLRRGTLNIANLEGPLTHSKQRRPHQPFYLKAGPHRNHILDRFDIFSLANNHILDYGARGLQDTIDFLHSYDKQCFGAGLDGAQASSPLLIDRDGHKLAFVGATRWNNARRLTPGTAPDDIGRLAKIISRVKAHDYFVIVCPHWNYEYVHYPAPDNRELAKKLIAVGADLVVGTHPHVIQGYEECLGRYVFHSLGNFITHSDMFKGISMFENDRRLNVSFILSVTLGEGHRYTWQMTPVHTDDAEVRALIGAAKLRVLDLMREISKVLTREEEYRDAFYGQARNISRRSMKILRMVRNQQGMRSLLNVLTGLRKQDLKVRVHSLFRREDGSSEWSV